MLDFDAQNKTITKSHMDGFEMGIMLSTFKSQFKVKLWKLSKSNFYSIMIGYCNAKNIINYESEHIEAKNKDQYTKLLEKRKDILAYTNNKRVFCSQKDKRSFSNVDAEDSSTRYNYTLKEGDIVHVVYEEDK